MPKIDKSIIARALIAGLLSCASGSANAAVRIEGQVQTGGGPVANSNVILWAANAGQPRQLAQTRTNDGGRFELSTQETLGADVSLYVVAKGGEIAVNKAGGDNPAFELLSVLGNTPPSNVVVNELTTVASAFTNARFINGESISGNPLGLRIAAGNLPNLADPATGHWGKALLDPINITQSTTLAKLNTMASLITAFATIATDEWRNRFLNAATPISGATPKSVLEAMAGIARTPWANSGALFALFDEAYPQPTDGAPRKAPFLPYLAYAPPDFALMLIFAGGGLSAPGKFMFDANGNLWSGVNWMPGSQSSVTHNIGGGTVKFAPNGAALSPPVTGFAGMGVDSIGWGTGGDTQ
jgi:hypothetical protein